MRVIAVGGLKGGTGKTSIAVHLAVGLQGSRRYVALVDLDPQGSAVEWDAAGGLPVTIVARDASRGAERGRSSRRGTATARSSRDGRTSRAPS